MSVTLYTVSGTVSGAIAAGVSVQLTVTGSYGGTDPAITGAPGTFSFSGISAGNFPLTVTPTLAGYTFSPASYTHSSAGSQTNDNFTATASTYSISGNVSVPNAVVSYSGASSGSVTADASGNYTITGLPNGTYTLTPSLAGHLFNPTSLVETVSGSNLTGVNFSMSATLYALQGRYNGSSLINAFVGGSLANQDLIQLVIPGDLTSGDPPTVVLNVDYTGAVHNPASSPTQGTRIGTFQTSAAAGSTTAQFFAGAWPTNPQNLDIVQVINEGGNISYYLNYQGVPTGS
jgi:hypothetical protein